MKANNELTEKEFEEQEKFTNEKERFISLLKSTNRENIDSLIEGLEKTDFYYAPSSTKYHNAFEHGLLYHSLSVMDSSFKIRDALDLHNEISDEELIISSLLHDLCKVNFYKTEMRNKKNKDTNQWESVPTYVIDDKFPMGHGEKSLLIIMRYIKLSSKEMLAINWHMGGFDIRCLSYQGQNTLSRAMELNKLTTVLHMADLTSTYIIESQIDDI